LKTKKNITAVGVVSLIFMTLGPILYLIQFAHLSADDFCRVGITSFDSYFDQIIAWYHFHNGRYFNALLSYLPVYQFETYRLILTFNGIVFFVSVGFFITKSLQYFFNINNRFQHIWLFITALVFILILAQLTSISEFFYWYASSTVYTLPLSCLFFLGGLFFYGKNLNYWQHIIVIVLIVICNGSNELSMVVINSSFFFACAYKYVFNKNFRSYSLLYFFVFSVLCALPLLLAPGSGERMVNYPEAGNLMFSLLYALRSTTSLILKSFFEPSFILSMLVLFGLLFRINFESVKAFNPLYLLCVSFLILMSILFTVYYATGQLEYNKGRIGNFIQIAFILFSIINTFNLCSYLKKYKKLYSMKINIIAPLAFVFLVIYIVTSNNNIRAIYNDIYFASSKNFSEEMETRYEILKNTEQKEIKLSKIRNSDALVYVDDLEHNKFHWINACFNKYMNLRFKTEIKHIELK
jgi:hypothetical protein